MNNNAVQQCANAIDALAAMAAAITPAAPVLPAAPAPLTSPTREDHLTLRHIMVPVSSETDMLLWTPSSQERLMPYNSSWCISRPTPKLLNGIVPLMRSNLLQSMATTITCLKITENSLKPNVF